MKEEYKMADTNNFKDTVGALFKGMDGVVSSKTVVGEAIHTDGVTDGFFELQYKYVQ